MKNLKLFMLSATLGIFLINSCSVERRYHRTGLNVNWKNSLVKMKNNKKSINSESEVNDETIAIDQAKKKIQEKAVISSSDAEIQDLASNSDELILNQEVNDAQPIFVLTSNTENKTSINSHNSILNREIEKSTESISNIKNRAGKKSEMKELVRQKSSSSDDNTVLCVVLAFFIPPLAVYLYEGSWTKRCTINLILTLLCGLPGLIHALIVILGGK